MCTGANCPTFVTSNSLPGGATELVFSLPAITITNGGAVVLPTITVDVVADAAAACGTAPQLQAQITSEASGVACDTEPTNVCPSAVTTIAGQTNVELLVDKVTVSNLTIDDATETAFNGTFDIGAVGLPSGESLIVEAFCEDGTTFVGSQTINGPIAANTTDIAFSIPYTDGFCPADLGIVRISPTTSSNTGSMTQCACSVVESPSSVLPVELSYFTGKAEDCNNELQWTTASELNNSHFELEYSEDSKAFKAIAKIAGAGTSLEPRYYSYDHENVATQIAYYRLKQVDLDGTTTYSETIAVQNDCDVKVGLQVNPVPVGQSDVLRISYSSTQVREELRIMNTQGQVLRTIVMDFTTSGQQQIEVPMSDLSSGVYYLVSQSGEVQRFVVVSR
jgi:hypothetical protein